MGEPEIRKIIASKEPVTIDNTKYNIVKTKTGHCDGCSFIGTRCPALARHICCTGGNILIKK